MGSPLPGTGWDEVVVGAGTAGAVLASRLSEDPDRRVLLIEAGPDPATPAEPPNRLGVPVVSGYNWDHHVYVGSEPTGRTAPYPIGKVVGGSSAINGAIALRGLPSDFAAWAATGCPDWGWDQVLPVYLALEADADVKDAVHGTDGPVPIRRAEASALTPLATGFVAACRQQGLPDQPDLNAGPSVGVGPIPTNGLGGRRMSSADTHLAGARSRPNLTVWGSCDVVRVLLSGDRATGVEVLRDGRIEQVPAGRVTVCAGGLGTPLILQRSGIGDPDRLRERGIEARIALPGVGANLIDHPAVPIWSLPKAEACRPDAPWYEVMARFASGPGDPDSALVLAGNIDTSLLLESGAALGGRTGAMVSAVLLNPQARGRVSAGGPTLDDPPEVVVSLAGTPHDLDRLITAVRLAWSVVRAKPFADQIQQVLVWSDRMVGQDAILRSVLPKWTVPLFHAAGTARMGPATDERAVVDQRCRVHQVRDLVVCDASVMPVPLSAPPSLSCVMVAEKVASWMD